MSLTAGFYGKIPSRGDFVRAGLPSSFVTPLDTWFAAALQASRAALGEFWTDAWMQAPIWRFHLRPGTCGPDPAAGLWLPSTDKAGRLFPLALAVCGDGTADLAPFLDAAEGIGITAVEQDVPPDQLAAALTAALDSGGSGPLPPPGSWWTGGNDLVAPATRRFNALPAAEDFASMLRDL